MFYYLLKRDSYYPANQLAIPRGLAAGIGAGRAEQIYLSLTIWQPTKQVHTVNEKSESTINYIQRQLE